MSRIQRSPVRHRGIGPWLALWLFGFACTGVAQVGPLQDLASFPRARVEIRTRSGPHQITVWVADTPERQAQGLMFVRDLSEDQGMLFIHQEPRNASMWMKNTYIELDMVFIADDGRIVRVVERTRPHSLETVKSEVPVKAVLELEGGAAARRGLRVGDRVTWNLTSGGG